MRKIKLLIFVLVFTMASSMLFSQGTTGSIRGTIVDEDEGQPLPGILISISSPSLMGTQTQVSDEEGNFRFVSLSPGVYTLVAELEGFRRRSIRDIKVTLEKTVNLNIEMAIGGLEEEVEVTAVAPTVDVKASKLTTNVTREFFDSLPKGRTFQDMVYLAPGVMKDEHGISFSGATGLENQFVIDGTLATGVVYGNDAITDIAYEFVEEVQAKTGGYEAEYGGALGGVVNVITKSGGNEYHGEVRFNYQTDKLYAEPKIGLYGEGAIGEFTHYDFSASFGGYLVKDKLWFFLALAPSFRTTYHNPVNYITEEVGKFEQKNTIYVFSGKLTFRFNPNHKITLSSFGNPGKQQGYNPGSMQDWDSDWQCDFNTGSMNTSFKYDGIIGENWLIHALVGRYIADLKDVPSNPDVPMITYQQGYLGYPSGWTTGGYNDYYGRYALKNFSGRWSIFADVTRFWGDHTIKAGVQYIYNEAEKINKTLGDWAIAYYPNFNYRRERKYETQGHLFSDTLSIFIQDSWNITPRLVLNLGIRMENQNIHASDPSEFYEPHETVLNFNFLQQLSPRIGFSYDFLGNGKSKIFGSYGRYFETVPLDINIRQFGYETDIWRYYRLDTGELYEELNIGGSPTIFAADLPGEDSEMYPPYIEEFILGFENELITNFSINVRGVYKRLGMFMEDGSFDYGETFVLFNPGKHLKGDYSTDPVGFPDPKREYKALEIMLNKMFSDNYQFSISYIYSSVKGNMSGLAEGGQTDPNITSLWDMPDLMFNTYGNLANERPHQFKLDGIYVFPFGLNVGASFRARSGRPYTDRGTPAWYGSVFLDPRGTSGRLPALYQLDMHLEYGFRITGKRLAIYADVFNVLNSRTKVELETRYTRNTYYGYPDGILPPWTKPTNPDNELYGKATEYQAPFRVLLGIRFSF
ncbi:MAG: TonB-dependent receptor [Elusimicrobiota bacterium]